MRVKKPSIGEYFEEEISEACRCISEGKIGSDILLLGESIEILKQIDNIRMQIGVKIPV